MNYQSRKYRRLIQWIADNDNPGDEETEQEIAGYLTVKLVADCYDLTCLQVANDVYHERNPMIVKFGKIG